MQWSIKMKFTPLRSLLNSTQPHFKTTSFVKKLMRLYNHPYNRHYNGQVIDHNC